MTDRTAYSDARRHGLALVENIEKVILLEGYTARDRNGLLDRAFFDGQTAFV